MKSSGDLWSHVRSGSLAKAENSVTPVHGWVSQAMQRSNEETKRQWSPKSTTVADGRCIKDQSHVLPDFYAIVPCLYEGGSSVPGTEQGIAGTPPTAGVVAKARQKPALRG